MKKLFITLMSGMLISTGLFGMEKHEGSRELQLRNRVINDYRYDTKETAAVPVPEGDVEMVQSDAREIDERIAERAALNTEAERDARTREIFLRDIVAAADRMAARRDAKKIAEAAAVVGVGAGVTVAAINPVALGC